MLGPEVLENDDFEPESSKQDSNITVGKNSIHLFRELFDFTVPDEKSYTEFSEIPRKVEIQFLNNDVNLTRLHLAIRGKIILKKRQLQSIINDRDELIAKRNIIDPDHYRYKNIGDEIVKLSNEIDDISRDSWTEYVSEAHDILFRYSEVMSLKSKGFISFNTDEDGDVVRSRINIINEYLSVIRRLNLLDIIIAYETEDYPTCSGCGEILDPSNIDSEGRQTCICGYYEDNIYMVDQQVETVEGPPSKQNQGLLLPFNAWLEQFLGISKDKYDPVKMTEDMDRICIQKGWDTSDMIRSGEVPQPNVEKLTTIMKLAGYSSLYKIKNAVRNFYWGWPLPVLSEDQIHQMRDEYIQAQLVYRDYSKKKQNINKEMRGYYHLRAVGYEITIDNFKIPSSEKSILDANEVWSNICDRTGIKKFLI